MQCIPWSFTAFPPHFSPWREHWWMEFAAVGCVRMINMGKGSEAVQQKRAGAVMSARAEPCL